MSLPELVDRKTLAEEMGVPRSAVDAIFRAVPVVIFEHAPRKVFVRREDVQRLVEARTFAGDRVR